MIMSSSAFLTLEKFDCQGDPTSVGVRWERWKRALLIYLDASSIDKDVKKRASLLHFGGLELQEIFYNIPGANVTPEKDIDVFATAISKLDEYFAPKQSRVYERHIFRLLKQESDEKFDKFLVRLRNQADKCRFTDKDEHIIDQIAEKGSSTELRKKILKMGDDITLNQIIIEANTLELVNQQLNQFDTATKDESVNKIETKSNIRFKGSKPGELACGRCGNSKHKSNDLACPARGKECLKCGLIGHFRQFCRTRQNLKRKMPERKDMGSKEKKARNETVNQVEEMKEGDNQEETHYVFHIDDDLEFDCTIGGVKTKVLVDSGCKKNLITEETWERMKLERVKISNQVANPDVNFMAYGSRTPLKVKGSFQARLQLGDKAEETTFYVITGGTRNLLGKTTAMTLGILKIGLDLETNHISTGPFPKFKDVLIHLPIDDSVPPVSQPYRY